MGTCESNSGSGHDVFVVILAIVATAVACNGGSTSASSDMGMVVMVKSMVAEKSVVATAV